MIQVVCTQNGTDETQKICSFERNGDFYDEIWEKSNERYVITGTAWNLRESDRLRQQQKGRERRAEPVYLDRICTGFRDQ